MSTLIRAEDLPRAERFEALHEMVAQLFVPMELRSGQEADYLGQFRSSGAGPMHVTVMDMMPITVARTPRLIRRADPELLKLVMPLRSGGSYVVSQGGRQALVKARAPSARRPCATSGRSSRPRTSSGRPRSGRRS